MCDGNKNDDGMDNCAWRKGWRRIGNGGRVAAKMGNGRKNDGGKVSVERVTAVR